MLKYSDLQFKMNELIKERLKKSIGKKCLIFLNNGFRFGGIIKNCDENFVEILDQKINGYKLINLSEISNLDIYGEEETT